MLWAVGSRLVSRLLTRERPNPAPAGRENNRGDLASQKTSRAQFWKTGAATQKQMRGAKHSRCSREAEIASRTQAPTLRRQSATVFCLLRPLRNRPRAPVLDIPSGSRQGLLTNHPGHRHGQELLPCVAASWKKGPTWFLKMRSPRPRQTLLDPK